VPPDSPNSNSGDVTDLHIAGPDAALPSLIRDCWNSIGVNGNNSCLELKRHVHCHNCPVYSGSAALFLDRPVPPDYRRECTVHLALEKQIATPAKTSAIVFRLGTEWLGIPTHAFQQVAERRVMHSLPHRRRGVLLGLVNIRGELVICASVANLLGLPPTKLLRKSTADFDRLLVAQWQGFQFAFPVDEVHGVYRFHTADLREPPATVAQSGLNCAVGVFPWHDKTVGLIDPDALFAALNRNLS